MWAAEARAEEGPGTGPSHDHAGPPADAVEAGLAPAVEARLLERAQAAGGLVVGVWEPPCSLVVPASYQRYERFEALGARFAAAGWPVAVRRSGGGLVPQGPGVLNLSLAWPTAAELGTVMESVYLRLGAVLQQAVAPWGRRAGLQPVEGSFCDGRFNLAIAGRKIAGTAQGWRRLADGRSLVLAHACLLVAADLPGLVDQANRFEAHLGSDRQYRLDTLDNLLPPAVQADAAARAAALRAVGQVLRQAAEAAGPLA